MIERPASLLKELLENAVDAGATRIEIQIKDNGLELISVQDNGHGMNFDELPYAFCRHATSKIENFADLYRLGSYGFRGEALASMASISRLRCRSTPIDKNESAGEIEYSGGQMVGHHPLTNTDGHGTSIFITDLFFNTPVRLKFIKSKISEKAAIKRIIHAFVIACPSIHFIVKMEQDDKEIFPALSPNDYAERFAKVVLKKNEQYHVTTFHGNYDGLEVHGIFSNVSAKGNAGKHHFLFANRRLFNDQALHRTIIRHLEKFWPESEIGHYAIFYSVPTDQLDVNVHPSKTQLKFFNANIMSSLTGAALDEEYKRCKRDHSNPDSPYDYQSEQSQSLWNESDKQTISNWLPAQAEDKPSNIFASPSSQHSFSGPLIPLAAPYYLRRQQNGEIWLIDSNKILAIYLNQEFSKFTQGEERVIPLLISDPYEFTAEIDIHFPLLINYGLEFDRLSDSTVVLRSIPDFCSPFRIKPIIEAVIQSLKSTVKSLGVNINDSFVHSLSNALLDQQTLEMIMQRIDLTAACQTNAVIALTKDKLDGFFHQRK